MAAWRAKICATLLALAGILLVTVPACSTGTVNHIEYVVDGSLTTYNTNTVTGAASAGAQAFARTLTGFGYHGPDGQVISDHDFGTISVVGGAPLVLDYQIADNAVYSDGKPVTCDDLVLAWAAQSGRFVGFDAASQAGYGDIAAIECVAGQKKARVSFAPERNLLDYPQLFTATSLLPAHIIADELHVDIAAVTSALADGDAAMADRIARVWNTVWQLKPGAEVKRLPSSGPYKIDKVLDDGAVVLVANNRWWGIPAHSKRITVRPQKADIQDRVNNRKVDVVDVATGSSGSLVTPDNYDRLTFPSAGIEQLIFAPQGPLSQTGARRALALCTPRDVIARDAAVPIANSRLNPSSTDGLSQIEGPAEADQFTRADPTAARALVGSVPLSVRIGYRSPNARLAALVGVIAKSCAPAGITITEVASETTGPQALTGGQLDVLLASTGGASGSGSTGSSAMDAYQLHTGNGNNLSGYHNSQIDGIINELAVALSPAEQGRLLTDSAPVLWSDMPTLPLYRQQRMVLVSKKMYAVSANPTRWGAGWNMDRWVLAR